MYCYIADMGLISALGNGATETITALHADDLPVGQMWPVAGGTDAVMVQPVTTPLLAPPVHLASYDCRNNRLALCAARQIESTAAAAVNTYGPSRVGVVVGSSTSGLDATLAGFPTYKETGTMPANFHFQHQHSMGGLSDFIARFFGITGPTYTVSTACSSAAKAMISAHRLIKYGICDAVITGGVDTLCNLTVNGFHALGQLGRRRSNPMSRNRAGLNIGEGGALFVLTKQEGTCFLAGGGESMDGYHMSSPHPQGDGAELAMRRALSDAHITATAVSYINLHGTGTKANDAAESRAVSRLFPDTPCSSTKPLTGHCLGASGAVEAGLCLFALQGDTCRLVQHHYDGQLDPDLPTLHLNTPTSCALSAPLRWIVSNSFAFGGSNCTIVLGRSNQ